MYHHIADGLSNLARSLSISRIRRLTPNEIDLIKQGGLKLRATLDALELSRQSNALLQKQLDRLKELVVEGKFDEKLEQLLESIHAQAEG